MCRRLVDDFVSVTKKLGADKAWDIPKIINMRKTAESIQFFGMKQTTDAGPKEAKIQTIKADYARTNRKPTGRTQQLADKHNEMQALRAAARSYSQEDVKESRGLVRLSVHSS